MNTKTARSPRLSLAWVLWAGVVAIALLAAYVHLLTSAIERGGSLQRSQASGAPGLATAMPATLGALQASESRDMPPAIPHSHLAFIVVP